MTNMISVRSLGSGVVSGRMDREVSSPYYKYDEDKPYAGSLFGGRSHALVQLPGASAP